MDLHNPSTGNNHNNLSSNDDNPNSDEHRVSENSFEDVLFIIDLSSTEHVENLEEYKQVENDSQVS
jgi:hypothetical protein